MIRFLIVLSSALSISSCSDYGYKEFSAAAIDHINQSIEEAKKRNEQWVDSLPLIIENISGYSTGKSSTFEVEALSSDSMVNIYYAIENLMDDSVYGYKIKAQLRRKDGIWRIIKAKEAWKCQGFRGHQYYGHSRCS